MQMLQIKCMNKCVKWNEFQKKCLIQLNFLWQLSKSLFNLLHWKIKNQFASRIICANEIKFRLKIYSVQMSHLFN